MRKSPDWKKWNFHVVALLAALMTFITFTPRTQAQDRTDSPVGLIGAKAKITTNEVLQLYRTPPRQYATSPLWVWNDLLSEEQIRSTLGDFASQGVKQAFVHPRPGLMTPYLSEDWFRLWRVALDEAEKLDMNIWIYDENSYPSGFAGGFVPEEMPESRGYGLSFNEMKEVRGTGDNVLGVWRMNENNTLAEDVTEAARTSDGVKDGKYLVISVNRAANGGWYANRCYVDLMNREVTDKFIEVTLEAYQKNIGDQFGKRVLGIFTDEPQIIPAGLPWTPKYLEEFAARRGYSLLEKIPAVTRPVGDWKKVRYDYYKTNHELFVENWATPYYEWCNNHGVAFTGHYWDHDFPMLSGVPDSMTMAAWQQIPGVDCLMNSYSETTNSQFGNIRFCREVGSIAGQYGRQRVLCEAYGAGGWDLRFEDMKRIADWLIANGINLIDEHLSYVTLRGARKADHPQSFSYHEPWWEGYHNVSEYIQKLCAVLSQGKTEYDIVVLEPTGTAWMLQGTNECNVMANKFFNLILEMSKRQIEYDLGAENTFAEIGSISEHNGKQAFVIGKCAYRTVVIPDGTETLEPITVSLLREFLAKGGQVISIGDLPDRVNGEKSDAVAELAQSKSWIRVENTEKFFELAKYAPWASPTMQRMVTVTPSDATPIADTEQKLHCVYHMRRQTVDGEILFVVNTDLDRHVGVNLHAVGFAGATLLNAMDGTESKAPAFINLPPVGSILLIRTGDIPGGKLKVAESTTQATRIPCETTAERIGPNVLTLDYCDLQTKSQKYDCIYYNRACRQIWADAGLGQNPWDSQVQFKRELIDRQFPEDSGFTVSYRFTIDGKVPSDISFVIERPDLYEITLNGHDLACPVAASNEEDVAVSFDSWWLDRAFGKIDISGIAKTGENVVQCVAKKMTSWHEIQAAFVIGDFSLESRDQGFAVVPSKPIVIEPQRVGHKADLERISWLSSGVNFRPGTSLKNDESPWIEFSFTEPTNVDELAVWNYNEAPSGGADMTRRGIRKVRVSVSTDGVSWSDSVDKIFAKADGTSLQQAEYIPVEFRDIRKIRMEVLENHRGVTYPVSEEARKNAAKYDNAFAGLSEIRFLQKDITSSTPVEIPDITVTASSELIVDSHRRPAVAVVNGSGLASGGIGWNRQGLPFYAKGVKYSTEFTVDANTAEQKYNVVLTPKHWFGSTAQLVVNGHEAGWAVLSETTFDITSFVQPGKNTVELTVVGTLRNTLGPLHNGQHQFSAWPGMFHQAPGKQPAGNEYGTLEYGLFLPIEIISTPMR